MFSAESENKRADLCEISAVAVAEQRRPHFTSRRHFSPAAAASAKWPLAATRGHQFPYMRTEGRRRCRSAAGASKIMIKAGTLRFHHPLSAKVITSRCILSHRRHCVFMHIHTHSAARRRSPSVRAQGECAFAGLLDQHPFIRVY